MISNRYILKHSEAIRENGSVYGKGGGVWNGGGGVKKTKKERSSDLRCRKVKDLKKGSWNENINVEKSMIHLDHSGSTVSVQLNFKNI